MRVHGDLRVGVATHTGRVRQANEDDYLVVMPTGRDPRRRLFVIADGMGGATGGAEASRAAVRAVARAFVEVEDGGGEAGVRSGFAAACRRVHELSTQSATFGGMGTTLTALDLSGDEIVVGHIGDSRAYLLRDGVLRQLTRDHSVREGQNRLTRCVGGGRDREEVDILRDRLLSSDRFLLATDGLWQTVDADEIAAIIGQQDAQDAATALVRLANDRGGPDNITALVVHVGRVGAPVDDLEFRLPVEEELSLPVLPGSSRRLRRPRWPWVALAASVVLGGLAVVKVLWDVDVLEVLLGRR